jgi:flagellar basal-body rod protein FlgB
LSQIYLFQLASQQSKWLTARQTLIADNIANANTPGFRARDIQPFSEVLDQTQFSMATTNPAHIAPAEEELTQGARIAESDSWATTVSGNSVSLEQELMKEGDINRSYTMNSNIKRVFHQMMLSALK